MAPSAPQVPRAKISPHDEAEQGEIAPVIQSIADAAAAFQQSKRRNRNGESEE